MNWACLRSYDKGFNRGNITKNSSISIPAREEYTFPMIFLGKRFTYLLQQLFKQLCYENSSKFKIPDSASRSFLLYVTHYNPEFSARGCKKGLFILCKEEFSFCFAILT